jgi:hypothetical protein
MGKMPLLLMLLAVSYASVCIAAEKPPTLKPAQEQGVVPHG